MPLPESDSGFLVLKEAASMCTRPDRSSVVTSARAVLDAGAAVMVAVLVFILALTTSPVRVAAQWGQRRHGTDALDHVDVQVLLEDHNAISDVRQLLRRTLIRTAHTWAPL